MAVYWVVTATTARVTFRHSSLKSSKAITPYSQAFGVILPKTPLHPCLASFAGRNLTDISCDGRIRIAHWHSLVGRTLPLR